jgi:hypothetical protein
MQRTFVAVLVAALTGLTCTLGSVDPRFLLPVERKQRVRDAAEAYAADLRWGRIEQAAQQVHPEIRPLFLETFGNSNDPVRFTHFEVEAVELGSERGLANVRVSFGVYRPPSLEELRIIEQQVWSYEKTRRTWYLKPDIALYCGDVGAGHP